MQKTVTVNVDEDIFALICERLPFLEYNSIDDLVKDALALRLECLLQMLVLSQSSHG
jgi:hypothetical protein